MSDWIPLGLFLLTLVIIGLLVACVVISASPTTFEVSGVVVDYFNAASDTMCAVAIRTSTETIAVIVVNKDNSFGPKTDVALRTSETVKDLCGKRVYVTGKICGGQYIANCLIETLGELR